MSFISVLVQCRHQKEIKHVHAYAITMSMIRNLSVANKLLYIYAKHKDLHDPSVLFFWMDQCANEFVQSGARVDNFTIPFVLRVCRDMESLRMGLEIHHLIYKFGLKSDVFVAAALVDIYVKCGFLEDARVYSGIVPDKVMMLGAMYTAKIVHEYIERRNFSLNVILRTAMIDMDKDQDHVVGDYNEDQEQVWNIGDHLLI
ncbi:pentatricopeptide repeat-containing protein At3g26630, chloroplastic-like [Dioscorea cayenensis subsp. rotundata]|uniref:Pentatricopeptide repeat-containing protein At3g26630, chloroplastic-like n=1 Tax=Dioscorea cayennensis subsp. rotundata TaxID=55577 RepID=A0AB40ATB8_DIOCR|nr:pentatricopeptide repeat-containing protein At3g26630, chloroplastic-like [Dioscorea cayenensis subsp. rotundata]